ncbi:MAG: ABC transporter substrate-binding protein, partial [Thermoplasmata archaeon]
MQRPISTGIVVVSLVLASVICDLSNASADDARSDGEVVLRIAMQDEPKTANILEMIHQWTNMVLLPVYETPVHLNPQTGQVISYVARGTDLDGNGVFEESEYDVFRHMDGGPLEVTVFYDFNGVYFHDGAQVTVDDLLFSYHLWALHPHMFSLEVLKDNNNLPGSNYSFDRWLNLWKPPDFDPYNDWEISNKPEYQEPGYETSLRAAVHFSLQAPYWRFFENTLAVKILPRHVWEGKGCVWVELTASCEGPLREDQNGSILDFGVAYDPLLGNGVGVNRTDLKPFDFSLARSWNPPDEGIVGTGPFEWEGPVGGGSIRLNKNERYYAGEFYPIAPHFDGIIYEVFGTTEAAVSALRNDDIDFIGWSIPPNFCEELKNDPEIEVVSNNPKDFTYLAFNMRGEPFGYQDGDPAKGDVGLDFRQAVTHLINKDIVVTNLLNNYGIVADGPVSPALSRWYNSSLPTFGYDLSKADTLLDKYQEWDPSDGPCLSDGTGCRNFPGIGTGQIEVSTSNAGFDPVIAATDNMIVQTMRDLGINARSGPSSIEDIYAGNFHIFIDSWRIESEPPDYFYSFFYSGNAEEGLNYPGYASEESDDLIVRAREELDSEEQAFLIKWAQGVLANDRPYDVLYFRIIVEAHRSDIVDWISGETGSIYNYWSLRAIHELPSEYLRITTSIQSAVRTDKTAMFIATTRNQQGDVVPGATVEVYVDSTELNNYRDGNLTLGGVTSNDVVGLTDINGQIRVTYNPPTLEPWHSKLTVGIYAMATHPDYPEPRTVVTSIVVYPPGEQFLYLLVDLLGGDLVEEERLTLMRIQVKDQDDQPVRDASVTITSEPSAEISPSNGLTDINGYVNGTENVEFRAP